MATNDDHLKALVKKRGSVKAKLTIFSRFIATFESLGDSVGETEIVELRERITGFENILTIHDDIQNEIEFEAEDLEDQYQQREEFEGKFYKILSKAKQYLSQHCKNNDAKSDVLSEPSATHSVSLETVKLPEIELPKFDGSYETWMEFRDIFESLIHDNNQLNHIQKFHYLRASLIGPANQCIHALEFSASNYTIAWSTLCDRFNNKQILIQNHLKAIFNLQSMTAASAVKIRYLYEHVFKHLSCLKQLGEPVDTWDTVLIYVVSRKLDSHTAQEWEKYKANRDSVKLEEFKGFLKNRAQLLETVETNLHHNTTKPRETIKFNNTKSSSYTRGLVSHNEKIDQNNQKYSCVYCRQDHNLFYCPDFLQLSVKDRISKVKSLQLCLNCLRKGHLSKDCRWSGCKMCGGRHNTTLHLPPQNSNSITVVNQPTPQVISDDTTATNATNCHFVMTNSTVLSTARVKVGKFGTKNLSVTARALLDCGSQSSFITSDLCKRLNLEKIKTKLAVSGISDRISFSDYKCNLTIQSMHNSHSFDLSCYVLDKITSDLPDTRINIQELNIPLNLKLADPNFHMPESIDILIGAEVFWQLLCLNSADLDPSDPSNPYLHKTLLGWIVAGPLSSPLVKSRCHLGKTISLQEQLTKFWEVEEIQTKQPWSAEERLCEEHFINNLSSDSNNRFVVSLPLKESPIKLGESFNTALKQFLSLEQRLMSKESMRKLYTEFLDEYERLGHMTLVPEHEDNKSPEYFMPHHGVLKESSTSTKLRVVFNASSPTTSGLSLNDLQMTGPIIQQDLLSIILRFRVHNIVLSSDIKKMYRQVLVDTKDRNLQKIVWRSNSNEPIKTYKLNTVTYGTTAASFLAIRCLHEIAAEHEREHPNIANIIRNDMYVDDLLTCVDTPDEARYVCENISKVFKERGFELCKWKSNNVNIISGLDIDTTSNQVSFSANREQGLKTLGLLWQCKEDTLSYQVQSVKYSKPDIISKRMILSRIASIFDPLGLISPCVIIAKTYLQKLWQEKVSWDEPLPVGILKAWLEFSEELPALNDVTIPRRITCENPIYITLHGFADASKDSYGACIYIVSKNSDRVVTSHLLCAKSKVAPIKPLTIPRLELCAALTLSRLISKVLQSFNIQIDQVYCWSDSSIVLAWLQTSPGTLQPFVSNRVSEIQNSTQSYQWRHVPSLDNPADIVSRGVNPKQLLNSKLWFHGPSWLLDDSENWPNIIQAKVEELPERRKVCYNCISDFISFPVERFSTLSRLKRSFAYLRRFIHNCQVKGELRKGSELSVDEINDSFMLLIKIVQQESFSEDYALLKNGKPVSTKSSILSLHPFIDKAGIIRVGGRLSNSDFPYAKKHPILLSTKHHFAKLYFESEHLRLLHAGPQLLLTSIRDTLWPISGRNFARKIVKSCVKCSRYNTPPVQPIMGDLPKARLQPSSPFSIVGVDYAGPFIMKNKRGRGCKPIKCWVALFICFSTRAIHLELVLSLSADDFIQAFSRFVNRRGKPIEVYSDNGTNFTKANKDLKEIGDFLKNNESNIRQSATNLNIKWHFIPANSPHFGGIWEAGVKSLKHHLKRVMGNNALFFFDFQTLLIRIEAILNSRPLSPLSADPHDLNPLTPAHFLIGRPATTVPEKSVINIPDNRLSQYQHLHKLYEHFWKRWSREYISELQQRRRWQKNKTDLNPGQLVLVKDDNLPPIKWRMGRILKLFSGKDGVSRVACLKTAEGTITRAVVRLCPLPIVS